MFLIQGMRDITGVLTCENFNADWHKIVVMEGFHNARRAPEQKLST